MKSIARDLAAAFVAGALAAPGLALAFDSGSTGADGAFNPTVSTTVVLPPSGIFNYSSVNIPTGVIVTFQRNATNTPVVILASGDVTIAGTLNVSGAAAPSVGAAGDGATGDDGTPGAGGPGGFDGGRGGLGGTDNPGQGGIPNPVNRGGAGLGPGGGNGGITYLFSMPCVAGSTRLSGGGGGGYSVAAAPAGRGSYTCSNGFTHTQPAAGPAYGSSALLPLIGGSGGAGGSGGESASGAGGGGGGGAILIAATGTVNVTGSLLANGGAGGSTALPSPAWGGPGGGGSGGAIRIIATTITGNGTITATAGAAGGIVPNCCSEGASAGAPGRIRLESENFSRTAASNPTHSFAGPGQVFVAGTPTLTISSVAGVNAPAAPTGNADITLPASTPNPVTVVFTTSGVPVGNIVELTVTPAYGEKITAVSPALTGSTASATASVAVDLPVGPSVLSAQTTYTVVASLGDALSRFANNERVEKVTLIATLGGPSKAKLITVSGRVFDAPAEALRIAAIGG